MKICLFLLSALALASCAINQNQNDPLITNIIKLIEMEYQMVSNLDDQHLTETIKNGIKKNLRDPDSAQFSDLRLHRDPNMAYLCGRVNAKNGFGGYAGYEWFFASPISQFRTGSDRVGQTLISRYCFST